MKVLMINVVCGIRSTGRICTDLATELEKQGHEVKIAYGRENVPEQFQKYAVRIGSELDTKLHGIKARILDGAGFGSKRATECFIEWVKKYDPDVIHLHNIHGYYINIEVLFKYLKSCGKKIIWTLHDCWAITGHSAYCDAIGCKKWKTGCEKCPQIKEYPKSYIDNSKNNWSKKKRLFSYVPNMTVVTPSKWLAGLVKQSYLNEYSVEVIYNGIDTSKFKPLPNDFKYYHGIDGKYMILGVATVWDDMKSLSDFISLSKMLDDSYQIVLIGLNDKQIGILPSNILGIERDSSVKELTYIYDSADVILNLTDCDNYLTVNLEARPCGVPVITYNTGGSSESTGHQSDVVTKGDLQTIVTELNSRKLKKNIKDKENIDKDRMQNYYLSTFEGSRRGYWKAKAKYDLMGKTVILGVAAIWDSRKGLEDMVRLSKILNDDYKVVLVGLSNEQIKRIPPNIQAIKATNSIDELSELYSIADYFVNPTYEDNYPTTNLEAMSCNTPVLTYNTGGSPESAMMYGKIYKQGKIELIAEQIKSREILEKDNMNIDKNTTVDKYIEIFKV